MHQEKDLVEFSGHSEFKKRYLLKTNHMKKKKILKELNLAIKGKNEMIGSEEVISGNPTRQNSCVCFSTKAEVYCISKKVRFI